MEAQNQTVTSLAKRSRFYQAKLDSKGLDSGERNWNKLPDLYVIMITAYDPFGYDYMMYTIHNKCDEVPELEYQDGLKYIYFYTGGKKGGNKEMKSLLTYLQSSIIENVTDEATQSIHEAVEKIKHSAEVRGKYMTVGEIMDYYKELGYTAGHEEGRAEGHILGICKTLRSLHWAEADIMKKLMELYDLSEAEADECLKR